MSDVCALIEFETCILSHMTHESWHGSGITGLKMASAIISGCKGREEKGKRISKIGHSVKVPMDMCKMVNKFRWHVLKLLSFASL